MIDETEAEATGEATMMILGEEGRFSFVFSFLYGSYESLQRLSPLAISELLQN